MNKDTGLIGNKYQNGRQKPYCIRDYINCKGINTLIKRQRLTKWKKQLRKKTNIGSKTQTDWEQKN